MNIKVGKSKYVYWQVGLRYNGFVGSMEVLTGSSVMVLLKPNTTLGDAIESLKEITKELQRKELARGLWE